MYFSRLTCTTVFVVYRHDRRTSRNRFRSALDVLRVQSLYAAIAVASLSTPIRDVTRTGERRHPSRLPPGSYSPRFLTTRRYTITISVLFITNPDYCLLFFLLIRLNSNLRFSIFVSLLFTLCSGEQKFSSQFIYTPTNTYNTFCCCCVISLVNVLKMY